MALVRFKELEPLYWNPSGGNFVRTAYFSLPTHYYLIDPIVLANTLSAGPHSLIAPSTLESTFGATSSNDLAFSTANCDIENWRTIGFSKLSPASPDDFSVLKNWIKVNFSQSGINPNGWDVNVHFVRVPNGGSYSVGVFCYFGNQATDVEKVPLKDFKSAHLSADFFTGVTNGNEVGSTWTDVDQATHANTFAKTGTGLKKNVTSYTDPHGAVHSLIQVKMTSDCTMILPTGSYLQNHLVSGNGVAVTMLIKVLSLSTQVYLCDYGSDIGTAGMYCSLQTDGNLGFYWGTDGCSTTDAPISAGNFYLITFYKYDGAQQIYVNGVLQNLTGLVTNFANVTDLGYSLGSDAPFSVLSKNDGTNPATNALELYNLIVESGLDNRSDVSLLAPGVDVIPPSSYMSTKYSQYVLPPALDALA